MSSVNVLISSHNVKCNTVTFQHLCSCPIFHLVQHNSVKLFINMNAPESEVDPGRPTVSSNFGSYLYCLVMKGTSLLEVVKCQCEWIKHIQMYSRPRETGNPRAAKSVCHVSCGHSFTKCIKKGDSPSSHNEFPLQNQYTSNNKATYYTTYTYSVHAMPLTKKQTRHKNPANSCIHSML
jgi:hypothetical protein